MKKRLVTLTLAAGAAVGLLAVPAAADGNAYGQIAGDCVISSKNLGQALKNGSEIHGVKVTAKSFAESPHCAA